MAIATHAVIATGQIDLDAHDRHEPRDRRSSPRIGITLDPTKALVFVHVDGTPGSVISSAAHDAPVAFDGSAWAPGDTGIYVVFPNTDVSTGTSTVNFTDGNGIGGGTFPVAAHQFTYLNLVAH